MVQINGTTYERVKESSTATGTGDFALAGAVSPYNDFNDAFGLNSLFYYQIEAIDANGVPTGEWEVGIGYLSGTTTLVRNRIYANSSGTETALNFSSGSKYVFNQLPALECNQTQNSAFNLTYGLN